MLINKLLYNCCILCVVYKVYRLDQMSIKYLLFTCFLTLSLLSMFFLFFTSYYLKRVAKSKDRDKNAVAEIGITSEEYIPVLTDTGKYKSQLCNQTKECSYSYGTCDNLKLNCTYGSYYNITCKDSCNNILTKSFMCRYCYQTGRWEHNCTHKTNCFMLSSPRNYYKTNCTVRSDIVCLGNRNFPKKLRCNWTKGYRWSTALILSITVGGFGVDRFYLGHWQEGIGKLFSFGGLGMWTLVDILLIAIRYLGSEDGSLYM